MSQGVFSVLLNSLLKVNFVNTWKSREFSLNSAESGGDEENMVGDESEKKWGFALFLPQKNERELSEIEIDTRRDVDKRKKNCMIANWIDGDMCSKITSWRLNIHQLLFNHRRSRHCWFRDFLCVRARRFDVIITQLIGSETNAFSELELYQEKLYL